MAVAKKLRLGEMLLKAGIIHEFQLNSALSFQRQLGGRLGASLIRLGYLDEETLLNFLADQFTLTQIDLDNLTIDPNVVALVPKAKALAHSMMPFGRKTVGGIDHLFVATSDPTNLSALDELTSITGLQIRPAIAPEEMIIRAIKRYYDPNIKVGAAPAVSRPTGLSTDEKLKRLVKLLLEKKILDKHDLEQFKG
jgi:type IV pilus assembly protein PilB